MRKKAFGMIFFGCSLLRFFRLYIYNKLGGEEVELYENFLKKLPERVYCNLGYKFSFCYSVETFSLDLELRR